MRHRAFWASAVLAGMVGLSAGAMALQPPAGGGGGGGGGQPPAGQPGRGGPPGGRQGQPPSVEGSMKGMNRAMEMLKPQIGDAAKKDDNLRLIGDFQRSCVGAKGAPLPHDVVSKLPADKQATAATEFRTRLIALLRKGIELEEAVMAGKSDDATKIYGEIEKMEAAGHDSMGLKEEE